LSPATPRSSGLLPLLLLLRPPLLLLLAALLAARPSSCPVGLPAGGCGWSTVNTWMADR
jgi:hypothetical protein